MYAFNLLHRRLWSSNFACCQCRRGHFCGSEGYAHLSKAMFPSEEAKILDCSAAKEIVSDKRRFRRAGRVAVPYTIRNTSQHHLITPVVNLLFDRSREL